jgi:hypothetical protein
MEFSAEQFGQGLRRLEGNGIARAVQNDGGNAQA